MDGVADLANDGGATDGGAEGIEPAGAEHPADHRTEPAATAEPASAAEPAGGPDPVRDIDLDSDIDARFAAIISPLAGTMNWDASTPKRVTDTETEARAAAARLAETTAAEDRERELRERRREERRRERARELAEHHAEKAALEAEYNSEDDHFTPPEPPPLPRLRRATVGAVALILGGLILVGFPGLLYIDTRLTMVLGLGMVLGGGSVLLSRLRHTDDDSDSGAVL